MTEEGLTYNKNIISFIPSLTTIGVSTVGGIILGGLPGGIIGLATSCLDEYLIRNNITDKHYLATATFLSYTVFTPAVSFLTKIFPGYFLANNFLPYFLSTAAPYFLNDFLDFRDKIEAPIDAFFTINKLFDDGEVFSIREVQRIYNKFFEDPFQAIGILKEDVSTIYHNKFLSSFIQSTALNFIKVTIDNLFLYSLASYSGNFFVHTLISDHSQLLTSFQRTLSSPISLPLPIIFSNLKDFIFAGSKIIGSYALKNTVEFVVNSKLYSLNKDLYEIVMLKGTDIIVENGKKILFTNKGEELIQNLNFDLFQLLFWGEHKLSQIISETFQALTALNIISKLSKNALAPYFFTLIPMQLFLESISKELSELTNKILEINSKTWETRAHITKNIEQINLRDGKEFIKYRFNKLLDEENDLTKKSAYNQKFIEIVNEFLELAIKVVDITYFSIKVLTNTLDISQIMPIKISVGKVYSFMLSNLNLQISNTDLVASKDHIDLILGIIAANNTNKAIKLFNNDDKIVFTNYSLMIDGQELLRIDKFQFLAGKYYAITGNTGCGKTSTLIDLKEGVFGALSSSGEISIGLNSKEKPIMFIDQKLYLPIESTLLEAIYFPKIISTLNKEQVTEIKSRITSLLHEVGIDPPINNNENTERLLTKLDSMEFKLSGGQERKIAIIQAILMQPDVLIMDETFTGLDRNSLIKIEQMISKYLPNTLILSVDHHAEDNNYNEFYDSEVHFINGSVVERDIASKQVDIYNTKDWGISGIGANDQCSNLQAYYYGDDIVL